MSHPTPEQYALHPTTHVPNSPLPVLVYRQVLPFPDSDSSLTGSDGYGSGSSAATDAEEAMRRAIECNRWIKGGTFKTFWAHHFHTLTHECYAVFRGRSRFLLGKGPLDVDRSGTGERGVVGGGGEEKGRDGLEENGLVTVDLEKGDVIVLPTGVAHCSIMSEDDFSYVGLYPEGSPKYDNNWCKASIDETRDKAAQAAAVLVPQYDPVYGKDGPLVGIWTEAEKGRGIWEEQVAKEIR